MSAPPATSPSLVLAHPTLAERKHTWTLTQPEWGTALTLEEYLHREEYLTTVPLAKHGGVTHWILTVASAPPDQRPILSSCETLRKRALYSTTAPPGGGGVAEGIAHGVGSVFTDPAYRGKGYASRMLTMVADELKAHQGTLMSPSATAASSAADDKRLPPVAFSFLFSDIGKKFYASRGWVPHPSSHLSFTTLPSRRSSTASSDAAAAAPPPVAAIGYHELAELCTRDESLLRDRMSRLPSSLEAHQAPSSFASTPPDASRPLTYVALAPDLDTMLWHLMREDFITTRLFGTTPSVRGAVFGHPGRRVWAVWTRTYQAAPPAISANTLYILRLVVEDESAGEEYLAEGLRAVIDLAREEAAEWGTAKVLLWNPDGEVEGLMRRSGLTFEAVEREKDSILSLMWYGDGPGENVVWVAGEKYTWC
ncbi:uncharacterized protein DNG_02716 [Cephalotrichum gorgonifer]|uniref:N-acetyltransferase domain-containing protein n=1 Tax=Cephalotrichum gorgonifer TaxID=2041049 RepID=A0AAE8SSV6_9PEZI|nr:uncharacterized protein DNG_02716 [Cephalotrichum gorgonifer]